VPQEAREMFRTTIEKIMRRCRDAVSGGCHQERLQEVTAPRHMSSTSIHILSCTPSETIVVKTGSSVYELIVVGGDCGEVLVRGGRHFTKFCSALFAGSMRNGGAVERHTIDIGLRMKFYFENLVIITSAVQSLSRHPGSADTTECAATH
jgi:hypothetical protein